MPDDTDGILRANLSSLISPGQMVGIDRVPAFRINDQWLPPILQDKILCVGIQDAFIAKDRPFQRSTDSARGSRSNQLAEIRDGDR